MQLAFFFVFVSRHLCLDRFAELHHDKTMERGCSRKADHKEKRQKPEKIKACKYRARKQCCYKQQKIRILKR